MVSKTLEACHIRQEPKPMNRDRGFLPQYMIPLSELTHHQTLINVDNVALSSLIVHCHCYFFSFPPGFCAHFSCFCIYTAVPLLVLIATDEDYCKVVETFGFCILF